MSAERGGIDVTSSQPAVIADRLSKVYGHDETEVRALSEVTFRIDAGEFVVLLGPSGSGKTTCLNLVGAIEEPTTGSLVVDGAELVGLDDEQRTDFRRDSVGFVFQFYNLVPTLTALENVQLVAELTGEQAEDRSRTSLERVGIDNRADHFPAQMSGGEQQRVAIARALAKEPSVLLCDEPTGSLDLETGRQVLELLRTVTSKGRTVLLVTHNSVIAEMADRVLGLRDGRMVEDRLQASPKSADELVW
jgi:putative ABC transport system ATP-binding protein